MLPPQYSVPGLVSKVSKGIDYFHFGKTLGIQLKLGFQALKKKELSSRLASVIQFESRFFRFFVCPTVVSEQYSIKSFEQSFEWKQYTSSRSRWSSQFVY